MGKPLAKWRAPLRAQLCYHPPADWAEDPGTSSSSDAVDHAWPMVTSKQQPSTYELDGH